MIKERKILNDSELETVSGGSIGWDPNADGTYTAKCVRSNQNFNNVALVDVMRIAQYAATQPDTLEGELEIIRWAKEDAKIKGFV